MFPIDALMRRVARGKLSVFLFHKVPPKVDALQPGEIDAQTFARTVDFIESHFKVLPLVDAVTLLETDRLEEGVAAITFDDGYAEWLQGAAAELRRRGLPATFFVTSGQFGGLPMWHERLAHVVRHSPSATLDARSVNLPPLTLVSQAERAEAVRRLEFHFKYMPPVMREEMLQKLEAQAGVSHAQVQRMSESDLRDLANQGFEIGAHTLDHPILSLCDVAQARREIGACREHIEGLIGRPVCGFAYPNGRPRVDYNARHVDLVRQAGYRYAVASQWGVARAGTPVYQLPRFTPWGPTGGHMVWQVLRNLVQRPDWVEG